MADVVSWRPRADTPELQDVRLSIGGVSFSGWQAVTVVRSMEAAAGGFEVAYVSSTRTGWRIEAGQRVQVSLAGKPVIAGWIDAVRHRYDATGHALTVSGRDASADLVDCTAVHRPSEWRQLLLEEIAALLAAPFKVLVAAEVDVQPVFPVFRLEPGETAWEAIERACRLRQCLAIPDGAGGLLITRAGASGAASGLLTGGMRGNVIAFERASDQSDRFSSYTILAQRPGDADGQPTDFAHVTGTASDPGITRYRPLVLPAEDAADQAAAGARAQWEAVIRRARAERARATVAGWTDGAGALWRPNTKVRHRDPWDGDGEYLIATVEYTLSEAGTLTQLELVPPEAYLTEPGAVATAEQRRKKKRDQALDKLISGDGETEWSIR